MFDILQYGFIQNVFMAGTCVAIVAAVMGYFLIIRGLTFAGHALPNIGFAGAAGAVLLGIDPVIGLLAFTISAAIAIGVLGKAFRERDIAVGIIMTFALGLGILFLSLYAGYAEAVYSILFGQIVGISQENVVSTVRFSFLILALLLAIFRPLLFSSFDPEVAEARGVPVNLLGIVFLILVAITVSIAVQIVGALLFFTLLIGPAATAIRIVQRPLWVMLLAIILGICYTWSGIFFAANGPWPVSFYIATISFGVYLPVRLLSPLWIGRFARKSISPGQDTFIPQIQSIEQGQNIATTATDRIPGSPG
jgi:zinc/manganese transport system permease protein